MPRSDEQQLPGREAADILVLGGGFAGVHAALALDRRLDGNADVRVVLVSRENFHLFTPLLAEVAASQVEPRSASIIDKVEPTLTTRAAVGLPENDFIMAAKIDAL